MANEELTPVERLQPCLLDRLTDDEPQTSSESRQQRVISIQRYRKGVLRDLAWLFSASAHLPVEGTKSQLKIGDFPHAERSVINFGTRHLFGLTAPDMQELEQKLKQAIQNFEPRILPDSFEVVAIMESHNVAFELKGELWANPMPEKLFIKTKVDLESGQTGLGDGGNG